MNIVNIIKYRGATPTAKLFKAKGPRMGTYLDLIVAQVGNLKLYIRWVGFVGNFYMRYYDVHTELRHFCEAHTCPTFDSIREGKAFLKQFT